MPPPPYRADQFGSLIRPKFLLDANTASKQWLETEKDHRQEADDAKLQNKAKEAEKKAVAEVVAEQVKRDIVPITSGQFERPIFFGGFFEAIDGLEVKYFDISKFRTDLDKEHRKVKHCKTTSLSRHNVDLLVRAIAQELECQKRYSGRSP